MINRITRILVTAAVSGVMGATTAPADPDWPCFTPNQDSHCWSFNDPTPTSTPPGSPLLRDAGPPALAASPYDGNVRCRSLLFDGGTS